MTAIEQGKQAHARGNLDEALAIYSELLCQPEGQANSELHSLLGGLYQSKKEFELSRQHFQKAVELAPDNLDYVFYLAGTLRELEDIAGAVKLLEEVLAKNPDYAKAWYNLGNIWRDKEDYAQAKNSYQKAIEADPQHVRAWINLGVSLIDQKQYGEAIPALETAIRLNPGFASAYNNLANALSGEERFAEAVVAAQKAIEIDPAKAEAYNNLGSALRQLGRFPEAAKVFADAVKIRNNYPRAHANLGMTLLAMGEFNRGWAEYEWRRNLEMPPETPAPLLPEFPLAGRTVVLSREQGLGDIIHFVRYSALLAAIGAKVIVEAPPSLTRLLKSCPWITRVIEPKEEIPGPLVKFPLLSLPRIFNSTLTTIPAAIPYLSPLKKESDEWAEKLKDLQHPRIGLAWQGNPDNENDRHRSVPLERFANIFKAFPKATFISVQPGRSDSPFLHSFLAEDADFATTAALMVNLDMVISVDTAPLHLAGALGIPTLLLLQQIPDWRWLLGYKDSPWYPSLRILRQQERGNWDHPLEAAQEFIKTKFYGSD